MAAAAAPAAAWTADPEKAFSDGVWYSLNLWDALCLSIQNGWAGAHGEDKLDELFNTVLDLFEDNDVVYPDQLVTLLNDAIASSFNCVADDGSVQWLSRLLPQLRKDTRAKDFAGMLRGFTQMVVALCFVASYTNSMHGNVNGAGLQKLQAAYKARGRLVASGPQDSESEGSDEEDKRDEALADRLTNLTVAAGSGAAAAAASQADAAGKAEDEEDEEEEEEPSEKTAEEEDGWQTVPARGRKPRGRK